MVASFIRYLSLSTHESDSDLTNDEAAGILQSGLALMAVQHVCNVGWFPNGTLGTKHGGHATTNAQKSVGLPRGMNIWCDLEGVNSEVNSRDVIDYCNAWYDAVSSAGYLPGLYVGAQCGLGSEQLDIELKFSHYWKSMSNVPPVANRGYQIIQSETITVHNVQIDPDVIQTDNYGGLPWWLIKT